MSNGCRRCRPRPRPAGAPNGATRSPGRYGAAAGTLPHRAGPRTGHRAVGVLAVERNADNGHVAAPDLVRRSSSEGRRPGERGVRLASGPRSARRLTPVPVDPPPGRRARQAITCITKAAGRNSARHRPRSCLGRGTTYGEVMPHDGVIRVGTSCVLARKGAWSPGADPQPRCRRGTDGDRAQQRRAPPHRPARGSLSGTGRDFHAPAQRAEPGGFRRRCEGAWMAPQRTRALPRPHGCGASPADPLSGEEIRQAAAILRRDGCASRRCGSCR
jgi:hypothetical protein